MVQPIARVLRPGDFAGQEQPDRDIGAESGALRNLPRRTPLEITQERPSEAAADDLGTAAFFSRFVILQSIAAAGVAALWVAGVAAKPFESRSAPMCGVILSIGLLGLVCVALRRWRDVQWLATHVVRIGLLGTVIGLIIAFSHAAAGGSGNPADVKPMIASVVDGMYVSLYATLFGIGTNLWLKINLRLLGNRDG